MTDKAIYCRVSTLDQRCELQLAGLDELMKRYGWPEYSTYMEKLSGKEGASRPQLERLLEDARARKIDTVMVFKLDRFGRSTLDTLTNMKLLDDCKVRFVCPSMMIDTDNKNPMAKAMIGFIAIIAELERDFILERTRGGHAAYRADFDRGLVGLTRNSKSGKNMPVGGQVKEWPRLRAAKMRAEGMSLRAIGKALGVSHAAVATALKAAD